MRFLVAVAVLLLGLTAHTQPARDAATEARVRLEGVPGGTGARIPPEVSGGAPVGDGQPNRHHAPRPPDLNQPPPDAAQAQPSSEPKQKVESANIDADAMDPATKARVRGEGLAGGTGARVPPEANGGAAVGDGGPNLHSK